MKLNSFPRHKNDFNSIPISFDPRALYLDKAFSMPLSPQTPIQHPGLVRSSLRVLFLVIDTLVVAYLKHLNALGSCAQSWRSTMSSYGDQEKNTNY